MKNFEEYWQQFIKNNPTYNHPNVKAIFQEGFLSGQQNLLDTVILQNYSPFIKPSLN